MTSLHEIGDDKSTRPFQGPNDKEKETDHETDTNARTTTICEDASQTSDHRQDKDDKYRHGDDDNDEIRRLRSLIDHHQSRARKLEDENTTLRLDLANIRFDLEHCRLELRQMTTKRDALRKEVIDALNSKAALAQNLGRENFEMISTIDKLETERDVLLEEVEKLRNWIIKNKGEGDDDISEEGAWVTTEANNVFRSSGKGGTAELVGASLQTVAWETSRIPQFPSVPGNKKSKDDGMFVSDAASTNTPLTSANTFDSKEDTLYSDEYLSLAGTGIDDEDDDESFQRSYHCTAKAGQSTGQDDSTIGSIDTKETAETAASDEIEKKKKKKRWGLSVKPRKRGSVPSSPNCVSQS